MTVFLMREITYLNSERGNDVKRCTRHKENPQQNPALICLHLGLLVSRTVEKKKPTLFKVASLQNTVLVDLTNECILSLYLDLVKIETPSLK